MVWLFMEHQARVMTSARSQLAPFVILKQPPAQVENDEVAETPLFAMALRRHLQCESSEFCCATRPCSPDHWDSRSILTSTSELIKVSLMLLSLLLILSHYIHMYIYIYIVSSTILQSNANYISDFG